MTKFIIATFAVVALALGSSAAFAKSVSVKGDGAGCERTGVSSCSTVDNPIPVTRSIDGVRVGDWRLDPRFN